MASKKKAKIRLSDESGKTIKRSTINTEITTDSPAEGGVIPDFEKPLVAVTVNNPFKKILYWLDQIRKHQTTTFALKLSIPLIALPVVILGVFSLGRVYGINFQRTQTPSVSPAPSPHASPIEISKAGTLKVAKSLTKTTYLLSLRNGELINLSIPPNIDLTKYANKQVLITGTYNKGTDTLTVNDIAEVVVFNEKEIPAATDSAN